MIAVFLVALFLALWLGRRRRRTVVQPVVVVIHIHIGDDGGDEPDQPVPVTDSDIHQWIAS